MEHHEQRNPLYETSMEDVAEAMGCHRKTITDIQNRAMAKFKRELARRGISASDLLPD